MKRWFRAAARRDVVLRSLRVALLVGAILAAINYTDRWLDGDLVSFDFVKMALTFLVPYCVCTYASVTTILSNEGG
jgi:hypothetical protein